MVTHLACAPLVPPSHAPLPRPWCPGELEEQGQLTPVVLFKGFSFVYIQYSNLYVVASASSNANVVSLQPFLHKVRAVGCGAVGTVA